MATQDREELLRLIEDLPDEAVHDLLVLARDRQDDTPRRFPVGRHPPGGSGLRATSEGQDALDRQHA